jgi:hypothetical protein
VTRHRKLQVGIKCTVSSILDVILGVTSYQVMRSFDVRTSTGLFTSPHNRMELENAKKPIIPSLQKADFLGVVVVIYSVRFVQEQVVAHIYKYIESACVCLWRIEERHSR